MIASLTQRTPTRVLAIFTCFLAASAPHAIWAQIERPLGINLAGVNDFAREEPFVNVFDKARQWIPHQTAPGSAWDSKVPVPQRPDGYPTQVPFTDAEGGEHIVRTMILSDPGSTLPLERFRIVTQGTGTIRLWGSATTRFESPVDTTVTVDHRLGKSLFVVIERSERADPVHGISVVREEDIARDGEGAVFREEFLEYLKDFQVIRFMDWGRTNNSEIVNWSDRTPEVYYSQGLSSGVSLERMTALVNLTERDAWICVPHQATDEYVERLALYLADALDPGRKLYIEYSNELWNRIFRQAHYAEAQGLARGYEHAPGRNFEAGWRFHAARSAEVLGIFDAAFAGRPAADLVKVLPTQGGNTWLGRQHVTFFNDPQYNPDGVEADALAIAPYFGNKVANAIYDAGRASAATVTEVLDSAEADLSTVFAKVDTYRELADEAGLELICYEAGQHLGAHGPAQADTALLSTLFAANRDARMGGLYCEYLDRWYDGGGDAPTLMSLFNSHAPLSKFGSWGMKETMTDMRNPKYQAVLQCGAAYNTEEDTSPVPATGRAAESLFTAYPNPSSGTFVVEHPAGEVTVRLHDALGRALPLAVRHGREGVTEVETAAKGLAFLTVYHDRGASATQRLLLE